MYTKEEMIAAIHKCGITRGDIVMAHVGMSSLRDLPEGVRGQDAMSAFCNDVLRECIGDEGTLVIPSFTYSLGAGEVYDPVSTPCKNIGAFPDFFWRQQGVLRSHDPFLAVASLGPHSHALLDGIAHTSYGKGSFFDRFTEMGGKILCVGVGIRWATIRYHYDEIGGAPFRYLKRFSGKIKIDGNLEDIDWFYSVAPRAPKVDAMSRNQGVMIEQMLEGSPLLKQAPLGRGRVCAILASDYKTFILDMLQKDPWATSGGSISSYSDIIAEENLRTGTTTYDIDISHDSAADMVAKIERIPREPLSDGYDAVLYALAKRFGMVIKEYPTGTRAGDVIVPEREENGSRSFSTMKIGLLSAETSRANSECLVCELANDVRTTVTRLFEIEQASINGDKTGDLNLIVVPTKEYSILAEGE